MRRIWTTCLLLVLSIQAGRALRMLRVLVPAVTTRGDAAVLQCEYAVGPDDTLYSVKWYKDNEEFFRYVPKANPPLHSYRLDGVRVDNHKSDGSHVYLKAVTLRSGGVYRCEVSAEAPSFSSMQGEGTMTVVHLPKDGPHISGEINQYEIGDDINLNCTSGRSHPASLLQWFINEKQVTRPDHLVLYHPITHSGGLMTSSLGLRLQLGPEHFVGGSMRVRCVATLTAAAPVLWRGDQESVVPEGPQNPEPVLDNREALLLVRGEAAIRTSSLLTIFLLLLLSSILR